MNLEAFRDAIVPYRKWLDTQRPAACRRFLLRLDSADEATKEGALGEAVAWNWLEPRCSVYFNESEDSGGVDFRCEGDSGSFFVEVTTITIEKTAKATGLPHLPKQGGATYAAATRAIKQEIIEKSSQVAGLDKPILVFAVTFHFQATALVLSTSHLRDLFLGSHGVSTSINLKTGEAGELREIATLDHPLFFKARSMEPLRRHISGVLVGGFGVTPPECVVRGVLHPNPVRPFDRQNLPDACFGRIEPWPITDSSRIVWETGDGTPCDDESERARHLKESERRLRQAGHGSLLDEVRRERGP